MTVATSRAWKNKDGEKQEETEWHRVVCYDKLAEICGEYLKKGKLAYFEGRLKTRKWTDKDGVEKYTTEVIADQMTMLGAREDDAAPRQSAPAQRQAPQRPAARQAVPAGGFDDMDSDIPF